MKPNEKRKDKPEKKKKKIRNPSALQMWEREERERFWKEKEESEEGLKEWWEKKKKKWWATNNVRWCSAFVASCLLPWDSVVMLKYCEFLLCLFFDFDIGLCLSFSLFWLHTGPMPTTHHIHGYSHHQNELQLFSPSKQP